MKSTELDGEGGGVCGAGEEDNVEEGEEGAETLHVWHVAMATYTHPYQIVSCTRIEG